MTHADVGVGHVSRFNGLGGGTRWRQARVDHPLAGPSLDVLSTGITGDMAVMIRSQRHYAGGVASGWAGSDVVVHDGVGPFPIQVEVIADRVQVPGSDSGRAAADFGEPQALRTEEPLH